MKNLSYVVKNVTNFFCKKSGKPYNIFCFILQNDWTGKELDGKEILPRNLQECMMELKV